MGYRKTIVDQSSPAAITAAIKYVNHTPTLRIKTGMEALVALYQSPGHAMMRRDLEQRFGAFDLHFGWFCRRVAEQLGINNPDSLALVDYVDEERGQRLVLKDPVVVAMKGSGLKAPV